MSTETEDLTVIDLADLLRDTMDELIEAILNRSGLSKEERRALVVALRITGEVDLVSDFRNSECELRASEEELKGWLTKRTQAAEIVVGQLKAVYA